EGQPLAELASNSPHCRKCRRDKAFSHICLASDAYGADQAFAKQEEFIYFCPCGLIRAVIPIIARSTYLGGFFIGQVRCDNATKNTPHLERLLESEDNRRLREYRSGEVFESIPTYDFSYFAYIIDTLSAVIDEVAEKELKHLDRLRETEAVNAALEGKIRRLERELNLRESALTQWKAQLNLDFFINTLSSIASLAFIENSQRTNEMCVLFAEHLRQYLAIESNFSPLKSEFDKVNRYLAMQKIRYGDLLACSVTLPDNVALCNAPTHVLLPFVEGAMLHGLASKEDGYVLSLSAALEQNEVVIRLADNTANLADNPSTVNMPMFSGFNSEAVASSFAGAQFRLETFFGRQNVVSFGSIPGGSECVIRYTLFQKEMI
ncbi:MAG: PocR ligand-binding domain-containing protein, partial [Deltaproteobacteria bacterium]|nr:PocR ligand-binding domain-containing protein [Deltaproteobacteria bacterium]